MDMEVKGNGFLAAVARRFFKPAAKYHVIEQRYAKSGEQRYLQSGFIWSESRSRAYEFTKGEADKTAARLNARYGDETLAFSVTPKHDSPHLSVLR